MSSWIIAKGIPKKKVAEPITQYHSTEVSSDIPSIYIDTLAAYIHTQKMGETCSIWDPSTILSVSLQYNPQIKLLKEKPDAAASSVSSYSPSLAPMKLKDIQKFALTVLQYNSNFNQSVKQVLDKGGIRQVFDVGIHITGPPGENIQIYSDILKAYQAKSKKTSLSIYVMADSYASVLALQQSGPPSWKIVSLSRTPAKESVEIFIQTMAEVQILSLTPALVLDFSKSLDRLVYVLQRSPTGLDFFKEIKDRQWTLI